MLPKQTFIVTTKLIQKPNLQLFLGLVQNRISIVAPFRLFQYQDSFQSLQSFLCNIFYFINFSISFFLSDHIGNKTWRFLIYLYLLCNANFFVFSLNDNKINLSTHLYKMALKIYAKITFGNLFCVFWLSLFCDMLISSFIWCILLVSKVSKNI